MDQYKAVRGTSYHVQTPERLISELEIARRTGRRLRIYYGDQSTGQGWGCAECGRIGRSMGPIQIPILIHNRRSLGGPGLLDHCIVRVESSAAPRRVLWECPKSERGTDIDRQSI